MLRLGVNIDHIATIREVRKTQFPDPVQAAVLVELAGADSITVHLRQDRRHIKERDIELLKNTLNIKLNVEVALNKEIIDFIVKVKPFSCCLVPERVEEITTEGGLDIIKFAEQVKQTVRTLKKAGIYTAVFIEPEESMIKYAPQCEAEIIELHTGKYADATTPSEVSKEFLRFKNAAKLAKSLNLEVHAGHGLHYNNVRPVAQIPEIEELNIGHSIISRAMFVGMEEAIREMTKLMGRQYSVQWSEKENLKR